MKKVLGVFDAPRPHWVGDGFPVHSLFTYQSHGEQLSPFLMLDYASPTQFKPSEEPRGVGAHPHRGFETVTIVYAGEVCHRDSTGAGGKIGPGDVQWMTAAAGIIHEEFHSPAFTRAGGVLEMVQLWVNLPARDKMARPRYQTLLRSDIPDIDLADAAGSVRVIAGHYGDHQGPAQTFTPVTVLDVRLSKDKTAEFTLTEGHTLALIVLQGAITLHSGEQARDAQMVVFERDQQAISVQADSDSRLLLLSGEPIDEPIVGYGPFVMNDEAEIRQAVEDFNKGEFGQLPEATSG